MIKYKVFSRTADDKGWEAKGPERVFSSINAAFQYMQKRIAMHSTYDNPTIWSNYESWKMEETEEIDG